MGGDIKGKNGKDLRRIRYLGIESLLSAWGGD